MEHNLFTDLNFVYFFRFLYRFLLCQLCFSLGNYLLTIYFFCSLILFFLFFLSSASVILSFLYVLTSKSLMNILVLFIAGWHYKEWTQIWMKLGCQWRAEKQRKRFMLAGELTAMPSGTEHVVGSGFALQARTPVHFPMVLMAPTWEWAWG